MRCWRRCRGALPDLPHEELLRADLLIAENSFDATRQAIADNEVADEEGKLILAAALSRYATALLLFSRLVLDGEVPPDLP
jgi:hypothetical protein